MVINTCKLVTINEYCANCSREETYSGEEIWKIIGRKCQICQKCARNLCSKCYIDKKLIRSCLYFGIHCPNCMFSLIKKCSHCKLMFCLDKRCRKNCSDFTR